MQMASYDILFSTHNIYNIDFIASPAFPGDLPTARVLCHDEKR